jgi:hypothetical protein
MFHWEIKDFGKSSHLSFMDIHQEEGFLKKETPYA